MKRKTKKINQKINKHPNATWLPEAFEDSEEGKGLKYLIDGQPVVFRLFAFDQDRTLSKAHMWFCCDCGLAHLTQYNVFKSDTGKFWLNTRSWRLDGESELQRKKKKHDFVPRKKGKK